MIATLVNSGEAEKPVSVPRMAELMGVEPGELYRAIRLGRVPAFRLSRKTVVCIPSKVFAAAAAAAIQEGE